MPLRLIVEVKWFRCRYDTVHSSDTQIYGTQMCKSDGSPRHCASLRDQFKNVQDCLLSTSINFECYSKENMKLLDTETDDKKKKKHTIYLTIKSFGGRLDGSWWRSQY